MIKIDSACDVPVVYMHVPKTAGTSVLLSCIEDLGLSHDFLGFDRSLFGSFDKFSEAFPAARALVHVYGKLPHSEADLVSGHISFSTLFAAYSLSRSFTLIREPETRIISLWLYWRAMTDKALAPWGRSWSDHVRLSRGPLIDFLSAESIACQTDNTFLRLLLWPSPLIPNDGFIDTSNDEALLLQAHNRLARFSYFDFVENERLEVNLSHWLGGQVRLGHRNQTGVAREAPATELQRELRGGAAERLAHLSRLDLQLWTTAVTAAAPGCDVDRFRKSVLANSAARHAALAAGRTPNGTPGIVQG